HIVYRRSRVEVPARAEEVHHAEEEGVVFRLLTNPVEIYGDERGNVCGMRCIRMELGEPDDSGRRRPVPIPNSEFKVPTDMVIPAVSQSPELEWLKLDDGISLTRWNTILTNEETGESSRKGVFAAGDDVLGPSTVVECIAQAHAAADGIHKHLSPKEWEKENIVEETPEEWPPKTEDE
ncbi:MAG: FAD-dependent oxidoreductase, partial [Thermoplasmata archaeon]|nr:FAD-dependent oxidoreductase [Thermoplasmata archaeon]